MGQKVITRSEAIAKGYTHYFTGVPCKHGHLAVRTVAARICVECDRIRKAKRRIEDNSKVCETRRLAYQRHKVSALAAKKAYRHRNKGKITALNTKRKAVVKQRTPSWLTPDDIWLIREAYELAALRTAVLNFSWNVDHVIPLQGRTVSGLHVPTNLNVIPAVDNIRKKNKFGVIDA